MSSLDSGEEGGERPSRPDWWDEQEEEEEGEERKRVSGLRVIKYVFPTSPNTRYLKQTTNGMQDFPGSPGLPRGRATHWWNTLAAFISFTQDSLCLCLFLSFGKGTTGDASGWVKDFRIF